MYVHVNEIGMICRVLGAWPYSRDWVVFHPRPLSFTEIPGDPLAKLRFYIILRRCEILYWDKPRKFKKNIQL